MLYIRRTLSLVFAVICVFSFAGCVINVSYEDDLYSRAAVTNMMDSANFGYGRSDDVYVALSYIYNLDSIGKECGADFEITSEDIICIYSEGNSSFFHGLFGGSARYSITIDRNTYILTLSKTWMDKWKVEECYLAESF